MPWLKYLGAPAAILAAIALYKTIGLPLPAWASDIQRLEKQQVETAIEVYQNKYRSFLSIPAPPDPAAKKAWEIELERSLKQLERAENRKIELSR